MLKRNKKQFTKRLICILFLIHISYIVNKEKDKLEFFEVTDFEFEGKSTFERIISDEVYQDSKGINEKLKMGLFDSHECLYDKTKTKTILSQEKIQKNPDENLRFILGQCNPVVMIPGLYSTRLMIQIDCKKFKENRENLINMRLFCGESVCKADYEEHVIWPAIWDSPFSLLVHEDNKYSSCFGYFFKYQNLKTECPEYNKGEEKEKFLGKQGEKKNVCLQDDSVKIVFYGGTEKTKKKAQCGLKSIKNIVSVGRAPFQESLVNSGASTAYEKMFDRLYEMGYRPGFSMAGVPNDFRRFISTNDEFKQILRNQVERLYNNTGKQVVVVAHSFGCSLALEELIGEDEQFFSKIKKFIAIAPPFAGSAKAVDMLLHGSKEFDTHISPLGFDIINVEYDIFAQRLMTPFSPAIYELKPNPILFSLFQDPKYSVFKDAISEKIDLEKKCKDIDCDSAEILKSTQKFKDLFTKKGETKAMFPTFEDEACKLQKYKDDPKYLKRIDEFKKSSDRMPNFFPCRNDIYDIINCPSIVIRSKEDEEAAEMIEKYCVKKDLVEDPIFPQTDLFDPTSSFFNFACDENPQCLDSFIDQNFPYPYINEKMVYLIDRFLKNYKDQFPDRVITPENFFESKEEFTAKVKSMTEYHKKITSKNTLAIPKVDTLIVYGSFIPTKTAFLFDTQKSLYEFENIDVLSRGGDGTVSSWSSLLVGYKWVFDKYNQTDKPLPQNIQLVEYCSLLSKSGSEYRYNKNAEVPQEFSVLSCDCLDSDGLYKTKETNGSHCDHTNMIADSKVIKFLEENLINEKFKIDDSTIDVVKNLRNDFDYEDHCNSELLRIVTEGF